jgi:hypothetical protein
MAIHISKQEVLDNLVRFQENLSSKKEKKTEALFPKRIYIAEINRSTGEIRFTKKGAAAHRIKGERDSWQEINFVVEDEKETVHFQLTGPKGSAIKPKDLDPLAVRILFETLNTLNELASLYHSTGKTLPEKEVLRHVAALEVESIQESIETMQGWSGPITRLEAEKALFGRPIGTYLLRVGEWTYEVAKALAETNSVPVKAYILTFVEGEEKISERLLLKTPRGWTTACDNSDLSSPVYEYHESLAALLLAEKTSLKPL